MRRTSKLKRTRRRRSALERAANDRFTEVVTAEPCIFSLTRPGHVCQGRLDPHHAVELQYLKRHFTGHGIADYWALCYSPEIGVPICRQGHTNVGEHSTYVYFEELPARVIDFCEAWGLLDRLHRECPALTRDTPLSLHR